MLPQLAYRTWKTADTRCLMRFAWIFGVKGLLSMERFKRRLRQGVHFPPYIYLSIINSCNLRCQGCWVDVDAPRHMIDLAQMSRLILDAKKHGNVFFGVLGGEPFMHPQMMDLFRAHPDCYFQVFTNGQFLTEKTAEELRRLANVTPLISIEGRELASDARRGNREVFSRSMRGLECSLKAGLLTGVATSVCRTNIDDLLTEEWLRELVKRGVHYAWYHCYRPVGPAMTPDLALTPAQLLQVRRFVVSMRGKVPIGIVDAYYDGEGRALCPMVTGISHHIGPTGYIEPCPILQFGVEHIDDERGIYETLRRSAFLKDFRETAARTTRGCIIMERPDLVEELVKRHGARDTTIRGTALQELRQISPRFSQWLPGEETPEGHWMYRLAKKYWFHDFGAYPQVLASEESKRAALRTELSPSSVPGGGGGNARPLASPQNRSS